MYSCKLQSLYPCDQEDDDEFNETSLNFILIFPNAVSGTPENLLSMMYAATSLNIENPGTILPLYDL